MKTNEVIKQYGITRKALQVYEKKGFIQPKRDQSGYRDYSEKDLKIIMKIKLLRNLDISLEDIDKILSGDLKWVEELKKQYDLEIKRLEVKQSYLDYVNQVIHDDYDVNEAIHSLDESIYYEENNKNKPLTISFFSTCLIMILTLLIALSTQNMYLVKTIIVVISSILLKSVLECQHDRISLIYQIIPYCLMMMQGYGIFCCFQTEESLIFKILLIFFIYMIFYSLSYQKKFMSIVHKYKKYKPIFCAVIVVVIFTNNILNDFQILHFENHLRYMIFILGVMLLLYQEQDEEEK